MPPTVDTSLLEEKTKNVVEAVVLEIKNLGDNTKASYEELQRNYKSMKDILDKAKLDSQDFTKAEKLAADISVRQEALDKKSDESAKKLNDRLDNLEVILQKNGKISIHQNDAKYAEELKAFNLAARGVKIGTKGSLEARDLAEEEYEIYKKSFLKYIQLKEDGRQIASLFTPEEVKTLSSGSDPDGGYTVTPQMSNRIITKMFETDPIRQLATVETITGKVLEWLVDTDESGANWETETVLNSKENTARLQKKAIYTHTLTSRVWATQEIIEDSGINIEDWIARKNADKMARTEAASFVTGDGVGKPRGFLTYPSGTGWGQIEQINMLAAATLTADGLRTVKYGLREDFLNSANLAWLVRRSTLLAIMLLKDGIGQYIWKPGLAEKVPSTIDADPVRLSATMPAVAANALPVAIGDWREAYTIVDRLGISLQRDPYTQKPFVEFYFRKRVGGDVVNFEAIKLGIVHV
jgi:HK97 family phage major capsid protein